jgi:hypothetical protein
MAMHSEETSYEPQEPREQPASRRRARPVAAAAPPPQRDPDAEALLLMQKVFERVEVAKSFAKIATGLLTLTAARAAQQLRVVADAKVVAVVDREGGVKTQLDRVRKIARAATEAAVHVATHRPSPADAETDPSEEQESEEEDGAAPPAGTT